MNKALEKIKQIAIEGGNNPEDPRNLYDAFGNLREVHAERVSEHRWWDIWLHVVHVDGMYIGYHEAQANRDESIFDLGWKFDPETIVEMKPVKVMTAKYVEVSDDGNRDPAPEEWKFACQVMLTKYEWLKLSTLAGDMSIGEYAAKVLREQVEK